MRLVVVGNLTRDIIVTPHGSEESMGGSACYCSLAAAKMGYRVLAVARAGRDYSRSWLEELRAGGVELEVDAAPCTTTFVNTYGAGGARVQRLVSDGGLIRGWAAKVGPADVVHLGPVYGEVGHEELQGLRCRGVSADAQGFVRRVRGDRLCGARWLTRDLLRSIQILHIALEEAKFVVRTSWEELFQTGLRVASVTDSSRGSHILTRTERVHVPAYPARVVDPTGAGDVYSAIFALKYMETRDALEAGLNASAAASFVVEGWGPSRLGDRAEVKERARQLKKLRTGVSRLPGAGVCLERGPAVPRIGHRAQ